jgi:hypothetical protein
VVNSAILGVQIVPDARLHMNVHDQIILLCSVLSDIIAREGKDFASLAWMDITASSLRQIPLRPRIGAVLEVTALHPRSIPPVQMVHSAMYRGHQVSKFVNRVRKDIFVLKAPVHSKAIYVLLGITV